MSFISGTSQEENDGDSQSPVLLHLPFKKLLYKGTITGSDEAEQTSKQGSPIFPIQWINSSSLLYGMQATLQNSHHVSQRVHADDNLDENSQSLFTTVSTQIDDDGVQDENTVDDITSSTKHMLYSLTAPGNPVSTRSSRTEQHSCSSNRETLCQQQKRTANGQDVNEQLKTTNKAVVNIAPHNEPGRGAGTEVQVKEIVQQKERPSSSTNTSLNKNRAKRRFISSDTNPNRNNNQNFYNNSAEESDVDSKSAAQPVVEKRKLKSLKPQHVSHKLHEEITYSRKCQVPRRTQENNAIDSTSEASLVAQNLSDEADDQGRISGTQFVQNNISCTKKEESNLVGKKEQYFSRENTISQRTVAMNHYKSPILVNEKTTQSDCSVEAMNPYKSPILVNEKTTQSDCSVEAMNPYKSPILVNEKTTQSDCSVEGKLEVSSRKAGSTRTKEKISVRQKDIYRNQETNNKADTEIGRFVLKNTPKKDDWECSRRDNIIRDDISDTTIPPPCEEEASHILPKALLARHVSNNAPGTAVEETLVYQLFSVCDDLSTVQLTLNNASSAAKGVADMVKEISTKVSRQHLNHSDEMLVMEGIRYIYQQTTQTSLPSNDRDFVIQRLQGVIRLINSHQQEEKTRLAAMVIRGKMTPVEKSATKEKLQNLIERCSALHGLFQIHQQLKKNLSSGNTVRNQPTSEPNNSTGVKVGEVQLPTQQSYCEPVLHSASSEQMAASVEVPAQIRQESVTRETLQEVSVSLSGKSPNRNQKPETENQTVQGSRSHQSTEIAIQDDFFTNICGTDSDLDVDDKCDTYYKKINDISAGVISNEDNILKYRRSVSVSDRKDRKEDIVGKDFDICVDSDSQMSQSLLVAMSTPEQQIKTHTSSTAELPIKMTDPSPLHVLANKPVLSSQSIAQCVHISVHKPERSKSSFKSFEITKSDSPVHFQVPKESPTELNVRVPTDCQAFNDITGMEGAFPHLRAGGAKTTELIKANESHFVDKDLQSLKVMEAYEPNPQEYLNIPDCGIASQDCDQVVRTPPKDPNSPQLHQNSPSISQHSTVESQSLLHNHGIMAPRETCLELQAGTDCLMDLSNNHDDKMQSFGGSNTKEEHGARTDGKIKENRRNLCKSDKVDVKNNPAECPMQHIARSSDNSKSSRKRPISLSPPSESTEQVAMKSTAGNYGRTKCIKKNCLPRKDQMFPNKTALDSHTRGKTRNQNDRRTVHCRETSAACDDNNGDQIASFSIRFKEPRVMSASQISSHLIIKQSLNVTSTTCQQTNAVNFSPESQKCLNSDESVYRSKDNISTIQNNKQVQPGISQLDTVSESLHNLTSGPAQILTSKSSQCKSVRNFTEKLLPNVTASTSQSMTELQVGPQTSAAEESGHIEKNDVNAFQKLPKTKLSQNAATNTATRFLTPQPLSSPCVTTINDVSTMPSKGTVSSTAGITQPETDGAKSSKQKLLGQNQTSLPTSSANIAVERKNSWNAHDNRVLLTGVMDDPAVEIASDRASLGSIPVMSSLLPASQVDVTEKHPETNISRVAPPNFRQLLHSGVVHPGNNNLSISCGEYKKTASILMNGRIQDSYGLTFISPLSWYRAVSGRTCAKRSEAYSQILYNGRLLTTVCERSQPAENQTPDTTTTFSSTPKSTAKQQSEPQNSGTDSSEMGHTKCSRNFLGQQVESSRPERCDNSPRSNQSPETLVRLPTSGTDSSSAPRYAALAVSLRRLRLIAEAEIVPHSSDSELASFWTADFAKITMSPSVWSTVDHWS